VADRHLPARGEPSSSSASSSSSSVRAHPRVLVLVDALEHVLDLVPFLAAHAGLLGLGHRGVEGRPHGGVGLAGEGRLPRERLRGEVEGQRGELPEELVAGVAHGGGDLLRGVERGNFLSSTAASAANFWNSSAERLGFRPPWFWHQKPAPRGHSPSKDTASRFSERRTTSPSGVWPTTIVIPWF
jgi:hypothetical protein